MRATALIVLAAAAMLAAGASASPQRAATAVNGRIVYAYAYRGLVLMNADGTGKVRLPGSRSDTTPAWSPDGTRIAVEARSPRGDSDVYIVNADGSRRTEVTFSNTFDGDPTWSPDGTKLAFESTRDGNSDLYVIGVDGSDETRLTTNRAFDGDPAWSPDGTRIAFTSTRDGNKEIYVMNADGSAQRRLTNHPAQDALPAWSPDGTRIAFRSDRGAKGNTDVWTMRPDGTRLVRLTRAGGEESLPSWQPLGRRPRGCTIWGTRGRDLIAGTLRPDHICGLGGNDTIQARDGKRDVVDGGPGRDVAAVDRRLDRVVHVERVVR